VPFVEFKLLGPLRVLRDGEALEPGSPKQRALLIDLLVHHGEVVSRDQLIEDLWVGSPPSTGFGVLQNYVSQLRKALGPGLLATRGRGYALDIDPDALDSIRFERLLRRAHAAQAGGDADSAAALLREARTLWRGPALADVAGEPFALPEIARLSELRAAAAELEVEVELDAGRHREVVARLERLLADHPLRERLWVLLMLALYRSGRQADALRAYHKARKLLDEELGIEPGTELRRLESAILRQQPELLIRAEPLARASALRAGAWTAGVRVPGLPTPATPIVGREAERAFIAAFLDEVRGGRRHGLLLLRGEPGIGKTRLLIELATGVAASGGRVLAGRAYEAERGRPYGAWIDAIRSTPLPSLPDRLRSDLTPLLPELSGAPAELEDERRLYDAVASLLTLLASAGPLAIVLDDVHWLDEASAGLLHFAIRALSGAGVVFAAAARAGELQLNANVHRLVRDLDRDRQLASAVVPPLPPDAIRALTELVAAGVDPSPVVAASNGNPLLVVEMAGALARGEDLVSDRVDALIGDRLASLGEVAGSLLPWLAASGRDIAPSLLADIAGVPTAELLSPLEELERHGILHATPEGTYDFSHDLVREVAYRRLSAPRRRLLHHRIATVLDAAPDPDLTLAADVARHADEGGDSRVCAVACVRAAQRCLALFAYPEAEALLELGRRHAARLAPDDGIPVQVQLLQLFLHPGLRLRQPGELAHDLAELCAAAQQHGRESDFATALHLLARVYHLSWGDIPRARALLLRAATVLEKASGRPDLEPLLETARCLALLEMDMPRTRQVFEDLATIGPLIVDSMRYQWGLGLVLGWAGDTAGARAALQQARDLAAKGGDHWAEFECSARLAMVEVEAGDAATAVELASELGPLAVRLGPGGSEEAFAAAVLALARLSAGEPGSAREVDAAVSRLDHIDARYLMPEVLNVSAQTEYARKNLARARLQAEQALALSVSVDRPLEAGRAHAVLACVMARTGGRGDAIAHIDAAREAGSDQLSACAGAWLRAAERMLDPQLG
jgi:DNA-binding SARP family transcriptional activator/tetratricopeptide (TPR) repeat protein